MTKKILLTATAMVALTAAGAANASDLRFRTSTPPPALYGTDIDAGDTGGAEAPYKLAVEAISNPAAFNYFALQTALSPGATFPSGNNTIQIDLVGGTFGAPVGVAQVVAPGCTTVLSEGGNTGNTRAIFLISSAGAACNLVNLDLPIRPNAGSDVTVVTTVETEAGTPIDPPSEDRLLVVQRVNAFRGIVDGAIGSALPGGGALNDTFATLTVNPVYTTFFVGAAGHNGVSETALTGQLGTIRIAVDTTAFRDLFKTPVATADVIDADVVVTGNFVAFNGAGSAVTLGATAATINAAATTATINNVETALTTGPQAFRVTRETANTPIPTSNYDALLTYRLDPALYTQDPAIGGNINNPNLETIGRDGTNVIFPWMNSTSLQAQNGTSNIIRLGNTNSIASGPVYVTVLNSTAAGYVQPAQAAPLFPNIAANGERVINTATLTNYVGEFGRGDILVAVEAPANTITARRYATLANGSTTEVESGTVANDQNIPTP